MPDHAHLYLGQAGQMVVMAEFLARGYNVAVPEVDIGDDIFVVRDSDGDLSRVQVKTASARDFAAGYSAQFNVSLTRLKTPSTPELTYVFAIRRDREWAPLLVIQREDLYTDHQTSGVGSTSSDRLILRFSFEKGQATCSGTNFSEYIDNWTKWPDIEH